MEQALIAYVSFCSTKKQSLSALLPVLLMDEINQLCAGSHNWTYVTEI